MDHKKADRLLEALVPDGNGGSNPSIPAVEQAPVPADAADWQRRVDEAWTAWWIASCKLDFSEMGRLERQFWGAVREYESAKSAAGGNEARLTGGTAGKSESSSPAGSSGRVAGSLSAEAGSGRSQQE